MNPSILFFLFLLCLSLYSIYNCIKENFDPIHYNKVTLLQPKNDISELEHYFKAIHLPDKFKKEYLQTTYNHHSSLQHKIPEKNKKLYPYEGYLPCNYPFENKKLEKPVYY